MLSPTTATNDSVTSPSQTPSHSSQTHAQVQTPLQPRESGPFTTTSDPAWGPEPGQNFLSVSPASPTSPWALDEFVTDPGYLAYQEELRCLIFNSAQTAAPTREATPTLEPASHLSRDEPRSSRNPALSGPDSTDGTGTEADLNLTANAPNTSGPFSPAFVSALPSRDGATARQHTAQVLSHPRCLAYLRNYVTAVAPWLDMFDSDRAFGIRVPVEARGSTSPALLYAVLALSARQLERKEGKQHSFDSLELYQEAIRLLTPLLQVRDPQVIVICTLLCCLEMMSASARDWRRHTEGCAALFDSFAVHGFSGGLLQAVFWCYARMGAYGLFSCCLLKQGIFE